MITEADNLFSFNYKKCLKQSCDIYKGAVGSCCGEEACSCQ
jgi:hypothetical protein